MGTRYAFDDTLWIPHLEDFHNYEADQWVVTETGSGTRAVSAGARGGVLVITNAAADNDANFFQYSGDDASGVVETWKFEAGKRMFFKSRLKVSDATQSDFIMGLQITDTTPLAVSHGIWFQKDDGDAFLDFHVAKDSVQSDAAAVHTVVNDTYLSMGFYYDGSGSKIVALVNDSAVGSLPLTNAPDDEELTISFGIQNGEAVAKIMSLDFISVKAER